MILCAFWKHGQLQRTPLDISSCLNNEVISSLKKCHNWWGSNFFDRKCGHGWKNFTCSIYFSSYPPPFPSLSQQRCNNWTLEPLMFNMASISCSKCFFISKMSSRLVSKTPAGFWCRVVDFYLYANMKQVQPFIIEVTGSIRCSKCF